MKPVAGAPKRRLFFALWPDETTRAALADITHEAVQRSGGRHVPAENFHITLAFLGNQPAALFDPIVRAGEGIVAAPFELTLDRFGYWPKPRAFWIGPSESPAALAQLATDLWDAMEALGLPRENRLFKPHITLARKVTVAPEIVEPDPLRWLASSFTLIESVIDQHGASYSVAREFPLAGS